MSRGYGKVPRRILEIITERRMIDTVTAAALVFGHADGVVSDAAHKATHRALRGLQRHGKITSIQDHGRGERRYWLSLETFTNLVSDIRPRKSIKRGDKRRRRAGDDHPIATVPSKGGLQISAPEIRRSGNSDDRSLRGYCASRS